MNDLTARPEELAQQLWFPPYDDHPPLLNSLSLNEFGFNSETEYLERVRRDREAINEQGRQAFIEGNALGFLCSSADNTWSMIMVARNSHLLRRRGIYEEALLYAITATRTNNRHIPLRVFRDLFWWADKDKLLAAGDPLPGPGPFTLYRGVAGKARHRRVRGVSWTGTLDTAAWFADRLRLPNPEVYKCVMDAKHVLAYIGSYRNEDEYIVMLPRELKPKRVALSTAEITTFRMRAERGGA